MAYEIGDSFIVLFYVCLNLGSCDFVDNENKHVCHSYLNVKHAMRTINTCCCLLLTHIPNLLLKYGKTSINAAI